jgi:hypothetical protein
MEALVQVRNPRGPGARKCCDAVPCGAVRCDAVRCRAMCGATCGTTSIGVSGNSLVVAGWQELVVAAVHTRMDKMTIMGRLVLLAQRLPMDEVFLPPGEELTKELQNVMQKYGSRLEVGCEALGWAAGGETGRVGGA